MVKKYILGIESSCDDTSIALLDLSGKIVFEKTISQFDIYQKYGGVVPEIASRNHVIDIQILFKELELTIDLHEIACIAPTRGPGMIGGLLVALLVAKSISIAFNIPLIGVNHLEGHVMSLLIEKEIKFPILCVLASGGHSQIVLAKSFGEYEILSETLDDSAGEAFDKIAKELGLGYPGGPKLEQLALQQVDNIDYFKFKNGSISKNHKDFSFSGLKTQIKNRIQELDRENNLEEYKPQLAFSAQKAILDTLMEKLEKSVQLFKNQYNGTNIGICGGVACNKTLQKQIFELCNKYSLNYYNPPMKYTTDNAVMIARAGLERFKMGLFDDLSIEPKISWPLSTLK